MPTVNGSSLPNCSRPHCLAAAICNITACTETFTAGTAILSLSVKSVMFFTLALRVLSRIGCDENAATPLTAFALPRVRAQTVSRPGTPPATMSIDPERSASFIAAGLLKVAHTTFGSGMPAILECFSTS
jgi:hypothetical protein